MKRTLIAAAVLAAASGTAFAHHVKDPYIFNATSVSENVGIEGFVRLFGCVTVSSTVGAVVNNNQGVVANVTLDPTAQSYTMGAITTTFDNRSTSVKGSGYSVGVSSSSESGSKSFAQAFQESSAYAYKNQSSSISGGGYAYSNQKSSSSSSESHQSQDASATLTASGSASLNYKYSFDNDHHGDDRHGHGSVSANGNLNLNGFESSASDNYASSNSKSANSGSGQGAAWKYHADQGSGGQAFAEQSSGGAAWSETNSKSHSAAWAYANSKDTTDVTVTGSVTNYIDTQKPGDLTATTGTGAGSGASGNIGMNVAEGVDNAQSNDASLASVDQGNVFGNAQIFSTQSSAGQATINNFMLNASLGDGSLSGVSGNVGVNIAAGVANVQNNSLAASTTNLKDGAIPLAVAMVATDDNSQSANLGFQGSISGTAMIGSNALQNATGNIGVNIAGGAGNLQHNGLAIAATNITGH
ncbi:hypothetical protein C0Z18_14275 [Trinickia dabaoshanensis]|uniref:Cell wall anchor protein n=1 Tax=Trinickia dabaoshanensis TaxID=564714 RepID=A0A2N7VQS3_9BURK|nr:hypothetical protein [Trinickia dabaoshanensis]PMS19473.1 hypothetical protein C0Z18_14275 [Trinickia dabaoshanensis]